MNNYDDEQEDTMNPMLREYLQNKLAEQEAGKSAVDAANVSMNDSAVPVDEAKRVSPWAVFASGLGDNIAGRKSDTSWADNLNAGYQKDFNDKKSAEQKKLDDRAKLKKYFDQKAQQTLDNKFREDQLRENISARRDIANMNHQDRAAAKAKEKELSPTQAKQLGLYESGVKANDQYNAAVSDSNEYNPTNSGQWIDNSTWAPNLFKNKKAIEAQAAKSAWIESFLRDASGAAIPPNERGAYEKDFFEQPGDTPQVVENKKVLRQQKMDNARIASGSTGRNMINQQPTDSGKITVTNGAETLQIDSTDLKHALADGYKRVK